MPSGTTSAPHRGSCSTFSAASIPLTLSSTSPHRSVKCYFPNRLSNIVPMIENMRVGVLLSSKRSDAVSSVGNNSQAENIKLDNKYMAIPSDVWTDILKYLPISELCAPCFTSKSLRDSACRLIDSGLSWSSHWWRSNKQLPVDNEEVVQWWLRELREPTREEVVEAARRDNVKVLDVLGWDDTHLSPRHRAIIRWNNHTPSWNWNDILEAALSKGSKKTISACIERGHPNTEGLGIYVFYKLLSIRGDLEIIRWVLEGHEVEGLSPLQWPNTGRSPFIMYPELGYHGHTHVVTWLIQNNKLEADSVHELYEGAGRAGRMDEQRVDTPPHYLLSLNDFVRSIQVFEWALSHNVRYDSLSELYKLAFEAGCMERCYEMRYIPHSHLEASELVSPTHDDYEVFQLAIDHGLLTEDSRIYIRSSSSYSTTIQWLHNKGLLETKTLCHDAIKEDRLDVLKWAASEGYTIYLKGVFFHGSEDMIKWALDERKYLMGSDASTENSPECSTEDEIYHSLLAERKNRHIPAVEYLLQRKWKKSAEEVQKWFDREPGDITVTWLEDLWKYGPEEESPKRKRIRVE
ncbi:hypothetical protein PROFUN_11152 [Planoprotostelium fungivorum]|uniref:F-box domain-containing protein n=1 Tax=Planoprotostelium fungivorum TaxID=1890364 RepID=A0A2P6NAM6_9EUKA|nr:hypothetical protein PROFUN_11152 [Planoprotostelium fungivorum]